MTSAVLGLRPHVEQVESEDISQDSTILGMNTILLPSSHIVQVLCRISVPSCMHKPPYSSLLVELIWCNCPRHQSENRETAQCEMNIVLGHELVELNLLWILPPPLPFLSVAGSDGEVAA